MAGQLGHEALTESHHLVVALALRVEIRSAFAAAHRECRERILQHLLEGEKLENSKIHRRVKAQASLVRPNRAVHLDPEAAIDVHAALIVLPGDAKHHDPFRLDHPLENARAAILGTALQHEIDRLDDLLHGLVKFGLGRVLRLEIRHEVANK